MILAFLAIKNLGIGRSTMIFHTYPMFAALIAVIFLGETISKTKIISFIVALAGMYVLLSAKLSGGESLIWDLVGISAAVVSGLAIVTVKKLHETDSTISIFAAQCIVGVAIVIYPGIKGFTAVGSVEIMLLIGMGVAATVGQIFMTNGFKYLTATTGSLLGMSVPIINVALGALIFGESVGIREIIALILLAGSTVILVLGKE